MTIRTPTATALFLAFSLVAAQHLSGLGPEKDAPADIVSVDGPRPVSAAIDTLERRCHCIVTYEDPKWGPPQVADAPVRSRSGTPIKVPRGGPLSFSVERSISSSPETVRRALEQMLTVSETSGYGTFRVTAERVFHVVPATGSILSAPVTFSSNTKTLSDFVSSILSVAGASSGQEIVIATAPNNLMLRPITAEANGESANVALDRIFSATGQKMSWRLLYDVEMKQYFFNINVVQ